MRLGAIFAGGQFSDAAAFATLLTVENFLFAALGVALNLSSPQAQLRTMVVSAKTLGYAIAAFLTMIGLAAVLMWTSVFADPWPSDCRGAAVAILVLLTIVGEVVFAWIIALAINPKGSVPPA